MAENSDNHHSSFDSGRTKSDTYTTMCDATATTTTGIKAKSNTCPGSGMPEVTKRYVERMNSLLRSVDSSRSHPPRGCDAGVTAMAENQTEVDPMPGFLCHGARSTSGSTYNSRGDSPDLEADLLNAEFIANFVTVQDLDLEDWSSDSPGLQEATSRCVVQELGGDHSTGTEITQRQASEERGIQNIPGGCQEASGTLGTNGDMLISQEEKHPKSDSGVGSTLGSPGKGFLSKEHKEYEYQGSGRSLLGEFRSHGSPPADSLGNYRVDGDEYVNSRNGSPDSQHSARFPGDRSGYHAGLEYMSFNMPNSFEDITPPDSAATLSPVGFHPPELSEIQKRNKLEPGSMRAMIKFILDPLAANPAFECFWKLLNQARESLLRGKICWLRDLEKFLFSGPDVHLSSLYKPFCEAVVQGCKEAIPHIREQDQRRSYDQDYSEAYFIDTLHYLKRMADIRSVKREFRGREVSADVDTIKNRMNRPVGSNRVSCSISSLKVANPQQYFAPQAAAVEAHPRQLHSFRQPLAIQTQPFMERYSNPHGLRGLSPRNSIDAGLPVNPTFNFENTTRGVHPHEIGEYHGGGARGVTGISLSSTASGNYSQAMAGQLTGFTLPPTPASAQSSPVAPPYAGLSNTLLVGSAAPTQGGGSGEEGAHPFACDVCTKRFPRACDLTKHKKTHERPFKCEVRTCKYHTHGFPTGKERERHENDIHSSNSKKWSCQFPPCTYRSKRESNCKQHMEKTHEYVYKRMKRNPRKKVPLAPVAGAGFKKNSVNGKPSASRSLPKPGNALEQQQQPGPGETAGSSSQVISIPDAFPGYGYPQQTGVPNFGFIQPHPSLGVGLGQTPLYGGSPTTDFEPSPIIGAPGYGNPSNAYHPGGSAIDHPDWPPPLSQQEFMDCFLSDFPQSDSHFAGIQQQIPEHPQPNSHQFSSPGPQFDEAMDCEWEGDSPD